MAGRYVFNLTVYDEQQGLSDTDTVTVTVKNDPKLYYLVDMIVDADAQTLTEAQYNTLKGKLALLIQDDTKLAVRSIKGQSGTNRPTVTFYAEAADGAPAPANDLVHRLRQKLRIDAGLLGFKVSSQRTAICQNNCSGHGACDERTRVCACEAFWMEDLFKVYFADGEVDSDCSWSVLYVALGGVIVTALAAIGAVWGALYLCVSGCSKGSNKPTSSTSL